MNLQQAKTTLAEISRSTATGHPKVLISQLCTVIAALIANLESQPLTNLEKSKARPFVDTENLPSPYDPTSRPPHKYIPDPNKPRIRTGNAGDAR